MQAFQASNLQISGLKHVERFFVVVVQKFHRVNNGGHPHDLKIENGWGLKALHKPP